MVVFAIYFIKKIQLKVAAAAKKNHEKIARKISRNLNKLYGIIESHINWLRNLKLTFLSERFFFQDNNNDSANIFFKKNLEFVFLNMKKQIYEAN